MAHLTEMISNGVRRKAQKKKRTGTSARSMEELRAEMETEFELSWLLFDLPRLFSKNFSHRVKEFGLTRMQWRVLFLLDRAGQGLTQTQLADMAEIDKAPLGKMLDRLEETDWIKREPHPTDRRARLVYVTSKLDKYADRLAAAGKATFALTLQGVRQGEVRELITQLQRLKRNLGGADD